uniref:Ig-like domain-containing protein n=1 Tax=Ornithorhynchus anatinus TaxID=9258 RepID=F7CDB6_ORNAN
MLGSVTLLLAGRLLSFLIAAGQTALTLNQPLSSITKKSGRYARLPCELSDKSITYIHWYLQQPGKAPQRLLYYNLATSASTPESGFTSDKIYAYKTKDQTCMLVVEKLGIIDAGIYYCASWDSTVTKVPLFLLQRNTVCGHQEQGSPPTAPTVNLTISGPLASQVESPIGFWSKQF